jgi:alkylation response protein AidB-like acyl-CoA dehydrogenase
LFWRATSTIPIVFVASDPVGEGLVASLARPGGNLTGISLLTVEMMPKRIELLSELVPQASPTVMSEVFWQRLAEQGWFGILYPEEAGGSRLGLVDMTVPMRKWVGRPCMTCSSISSAPRPAGSPSATRPGTANASRA